MKTTTSYFSFILLLLFIGILTTDSLAQRNLSYQDLVNRNQQQNGSFDYITLPDSNEDLVQFVVIFNLPYNALPFKKNSDRSSEYEYVSTLELGLEVFKSGDANFDKKDKDDINVEGLDPAGRSFWSDTVYAKNYDSTRSENKFASGFINVSLNPGSYNYVLQMKRGEKVESQISRTRNINLKPYDDKKVGSILFSSNFSENRNTSRFILNSRGNTVAYAKDFYAMAYLPNYKENATYTIEIKRLNPFNKDTTVSEMVHTQELNVDHIKTDIRPRLTSSDDKPSLDLKNDDKGFTYAVVKIPNSEFPNALYEISIKDNEDRVVARDDFRSRWIDMPVSLLNLDIAIEMLRFITDKETIREISDGSTAKREQKFREFWEKRDPTPNTEFNELMAEYYKRIDYAYEHFSTENTVGYNSDRGEVYIKYGPPNDVNRKFPPSGATTEIWTYPKQKFVFRATTGFGDFKLISNQSR
ncbi:MAG: GWxTD domain-containing protein [Bacteroidota bacterium]